MAHITAIATTDVAADGTVSPPVPRNMEVAELKIKQLRVNMSNGLINIDGDRGVVRPTPDKVPRGDATGILEDGWLSNNIVRDPATVVRTDDHRLTDERYPTQHAAAHMHGGAMEIGVTASTPHAIPKADSAGHLDTMYLDDAVRDTLHKARLMYLDKVIGLGIYE